MMSDTIERNDNEDGIDRRGFLKCMAWAGTGVLWTISGGILSSRSFAQMADHCAEAAKGELHFAQISDSHIGFNKPANPDVIGTFQAALAKIDALPVAPAFLIHTGDISHLAKPTEFDTVDQMLKTTKTRQVFTVPGEHDVTDNGALYLARYGKGTKGQGWYSFHQKGVHFIGLVNVMDLKAGGLGTLGKEQLEWLEKDVKSLSSSTPIVVFAHIPLWSVYPQWGWGTDDSAQALSYLKRFGSVTVLNGHIHQTLQKVEGNVTFHTAASTAFPQPKPGEGAGPGPMKVAPDRLRSLLGVTNVRYVQGKHSLAVVDTSLAQEASSNAAPGTASQVKIDNFTFTPGVLTVSAGSRITWINRDDIPHTVVETNKRFQSPVLDTDQEFTHTFDRPGEYAYYCSMHPKMTGKIVVR
jgi:Icc protein